MSTTYRAAYLIADEGSSGSGTLLSHREHSHLGDATLRAEALAEALRGDIIDMEEADPEKAFPRLTRAQFDAALTIGEWRE